MLQSSPYNRFFLTAAHLRTIETAKHESRGTVWRHSPENNLRCIGHEYTGCSMRMKESMETNHIGCLAKGRSTCGSMLSGKCSQPDSKSLSDAIWDIFSISEQWQPSPSPTAALKIFPVGPKTPRPVALIAWSNICRAGSKISCSKTCGENRFVKGNGDCDSLLHHFLRDILYTYTRMSTH
jgi:hypothetical protein